MANNDIVVLCGAGEYDDESDNGMNMKYLIRWLCGIDHGAIRLTLRTLGHVSLFDEDCITIPNHYNDYGPIEFCGNILHFDKSGYRIPLELVNSIIFRVFYNIMPGSQSPAFAKLFMGKIKINTVSEFMQFIRIVTNNYYKYAQDLFEEYVVSILDKNEQMSFIKRTNKISQ